MYSVICYVLCFMYSVSFMQFCYLLNCHGGRTLTGKIYKFRFLKDV